MILQHKVALTINALTSIALSPSGRMTINELHEKFNVSESYLEQIFRVLTAHRIAEGHRGPGGGYELTERTRETTIIDLMDMMDEIRHPEHGNETFQDTHPQLRWIFEIVAESMQFLTIGIFIDSKRAMGSRP